MIGVAKRQEWSLIKYIFLIPLYWLLISFAGAIALYQLILKPHYWEKTVHGFHLKKNAKTILPQVVIEVEEDFGWMPFPKKFRKRLAKTLVNRKAYLSGAFLVASNMLSNLINFAFNIYIGRVQNVSDFGLVSLISSLLYLVNIPINALSTTTNYRGGYLDVQKGSEASHAFWKVTRRKGLILGIGATAIWLALTPFLPGFFATSSIIPFLLFSCVLLFGFMGSVDRGYLSGKLLFGFIAIITLIDPVLRILISTLLVHVGHPELAYSALILPLILAIIFGWESSKSQEPKDLKKEDITSETTRFPRSFYLASLLTGLSAISFLSLDIVLAKHFLSPEDAGRY